jgi:hypothetical protein
LPGDFVCLRSKDVKDILTAQGDTIWIPLPFSSQKIYPWQPVIDGHTVLGQPLHRLINGSYNPVESGVCIFFFHQSVQQESV